MRLSPCIQLCELNEGICIGCHRTTQQIMEWRDYSMEDRMRLMKELQARHPRSYCPACGVHNKCAIELGKSSSTCWCMTTEKTYNPDTQYDSCLCHNCLTKEEE